jgi:hypothetical protein
MPKSLYIAFLLSFAGFILSLLVLIAGTNGYLIDAAITTVSLSLFAMVAFEVVLSTLKYTYHLNKPSQRVGWVSQYLLNECQGLYELNTTTRSSLNVHCEKPRYYPQKLSASFGFFTFGAVANGLQAIILFVLIVRKSDWIPLPFLFAGVRACFLLPQILADLE